MRGLFASPVISELPHNTSYVVKIMRKALGDGEMKKADEVMLLAAIFLVSLLLAVGIIVFNGEVL